MSCCFSSKLLSVSMKYGVPNVKLAIQACWMITVKNTNFVKIAWATKICSRF